MGQYMHGKEPNLERMMWDVYNAHGENGGKDVTDAIRHYNIPDGAKVAIVERIKRSPFLTPNEIKGIIEQSLRTPEVVEWTARVDLLNAEIVHLRTEADDLHAQVERMRKGGAVIAKKLNARYRNSRRYDGQGHDEIETRAICREAELFLLSFVATAKEPQS